MKRLSFLFAPAILLATTLAHAQPGGVVGLRAEKGSAPQISADAIIDHVKILASDEYEGRAPGTRGEELAVTYIAGQFKKLRLKPGNTDGTYFQKVPLVGITADPNTTLTFAKGDTKQVLNFRDDVVAWTKHVTDKVAVENSDVVFAGYGITAPEFDWDDFKGLDVAGKTLIVLVGDPPVPDPADPSTLDPKTFGGRAMTYYGRWSYKYEEGMRRKAAAVFIVHETEPASYPFAVVQGRVSEQFDLIADDNNLSRVPIEGWITFEQAQKLFAMAGQDFAALKQQAVTREFKPVPFGVAASMTLRNTIRKIDSRNVVAKLEGSDPTLKDEYVIYTAHWDHFGIGAPVDGDSIYNGALDNASGVGGMIELARAFTKLPEPPKRSILFLSVTAEEQGLIGSEYYAQNPIYPLSKTLAVINMDSFNIYGRTKDLTIVGLGNSDLDDYAEKAAAEQGRVVKPDPRPESGGFYRSDHFPFAKQGVPALAAGGGSDFIGKPPEYAKQVRDTYVAQHYHKPSDELRPDWDLSGAVEDIQLYFMVGLRVSNADTYPEWKPGTEFKAKREAMLK
jgi:Zn-dependent M28 family amino/carboxypeptidase